jgi:hypothetical protein
MSIAARIRELDARHTRLDTQLDELSKHSSADSLEVASLKKQKLRIKEQIEQLRLSVQGELAE